jgi:transcription antitermination factor NusG
MEDNILRASWYALKVFYNKVFEIEDYLRDDGTESYIPCETVERIARGIKRLDRRPVISSLVFFRTTVQHALQLQGVLRDRVILYTDRTAEKKRPAAIPDREMQMFMLVTSSGAQGLEYFSDTGLAYHTGDRVRVTGGIFEGAEGYILRVKGNRRLVVSIQGICAVATSYIPGCFLEKIPT